ncbi:MAG: alpha/beta hydrolase [Acidobacteria bacterium]|nr:alpha/beta hydrolase [Acidobacteriota bacterium]
MRRGLSIAAAALCLLAIAGATYQALAFRAEAHSSAHPKRLVDAGGFRLNVYCTGQGSPTVLLEAGFADSLESWRRVQPEIARFTRVCSYDRAGYGYSDPGPAPRTADKIARELHQALSNAGERPPYILAGHSFGGYLVRVFNGAYPGEVAGLVLVDATQEDQYRLLPKAWSDLGEATRRRARRQSFWAPFYIGLGIARLEFRLKGQDPPPLLLQSKYLRARASELLNIQASAEQARAAGHMEDKPLIVLTAGQTIDAALRAALSASDQKAYAGVWINVLQMRLANLSSRGQRIILPSSGHDVPAEAPGAIVTAVRELLKSASKPR